MRAGLQRSRSAIEHIFLLLHPRQRAVASGRFDTTHACGNASFADHFKKPDIASARHMRAAAQFTRGADIEHTHFVAVFLAEQRHRPCFDGIVKFHHAR